MQNFIYSLINDNSVNRKVNLLKSLNNGEKLVPAKKLAHQLHCTSRTIINDISELKGDLPKNWDIISVIGKGYILTKPMFDSISPVIYKYLTESILYKIMIGIFHNRHLSKENWSQTLYIHRSTLEKYLKNYSKVLGRVQLRFNATSGELRLAGNESNIRHYFVTFFYYIHKLSDIPLLSIELNKIFINIMYKYKVYIDPVLLNSVVFVNINRFCNKNYISQKIKYKSVYTDEQSSCFQEIILAIEDYYSITLPENEKDAINITLFLISTSIQPQGKLIIEYLSKYEQEIYKRYLNLVSVLVSENTLQSESEEELKVNLVSYFYKIYIMNGFQFSVGDAFDFHHESDFYSPRNYKENLALISNWNLSYNGGEFSIDEIKHITIHATTFLNSLSETIDILLLFSGTTLHQDIIYRRLTRVLGGKVKIHRMINYETKYNFCITNCEIQKSETPVIYIGDTLSENEIYAIKKIILN